VPAQVTPLTAEQQIAKLQEKIAGLRLTVHDLNINLDRLRTPLGHKYLQALMACYDQQISLLRATSALYRWQNFASSVMMWTVVAVVIAGLTFAGYQLYFSVRLDRTTDGSIEVSANKLKVTSSISGVTILAMSIIFVLIFVNGVYTITAPPSSTAVDSCMGGIVR